MHAGAGVEDLSKYGGGSHPISDRRSWTRSFRTDREVLIDAGHLLDDTGPPTHHVRFAWVVFCGQIWVVTTLVTASGRALSGISRVVLPNAVSRVTT